uniref:Uncharacterized protein n=1 Tax=Romanomermis culicivorax TaxID=13658 RepID=A0A915HT74_ROMCU
MAILDCNVAIAPPIDDNSHLFMEWANKWPVHEDEHLCNVNQALLECAFSLITILNEIEKVNGDLSYVQKAKISSVNMANSENIQQCLDSSTKITPPLFGHLLCSKLKECSCKDKTLAMALQNL